MRKVWTPSIVPNGADQNIYLVMADFGRHGRAWCEVDTQRTDLVRRCDLAAHDVPSAIQDFVERNEGHTRQLTLRLA